VLEVQRRFVALRRSAAAEMRLYHSGPTTTSLFTRMTSLAPAIENASLQPRTSRHSRVVRTAPLDGRRSRQPVPPRLRSRTAQSRDRRRSELSPSSGVNEQRIKAQNVVRSVVDRNDDHRSVRVCDVAGRVVETGGWVEGQDEFLCQVVSRGILALMAPSAVVILPRFLGHLIRPGDRGCPGVC